MSEIEKINREYMMIGNDLRLARESALLRIIRNKRQPIASRYSAMLHYQGMIPHYLPDSSEEKLGAFVALFLSNLDRDSQ